MGPVELRVVVPIFGYSDRLEPLHARLEAALDPLRIPYQALYVEDGGSEQSWSRVKALAARNSRALGVRLDRNYGQHAAIAAGLAHCRGYWSIVMDGDGQDPPEFLPTLWEAAGQGYDLVMTVRRSTGQRPMRHLLGALHHSLLLRRWNPPRYACFSLLSPDAVEQYLGDPERTRAFIPVLLQLRSRRAELPYDRAPSPTTSYSTRRLLKLALLRLLTGFWPALSAAPPSPTVAERTFDA